MDNEFKASIGSKKFAYGELIRATNNFTDEQKLGENEDLVGFIKVS